MGLLLITITIIITTAIKLGVKIIIIRDAIVYEASLIVYFIIDA